MKISSLFENDKPKKQTKTDTKQRPDLSAFQNIPSGDDANLPSAPKPERQQTPTGPQDATNLPRATQADTLRATQNIRPTGDMMNMLNRMRNIEADADDEGYPEQETGTDLTIRSSNDLPSAVNNAMTTAGFQNPDWHTVANLPGNMGAGIRRLGKELFKAFTRTPTNNIVMIGNVGGQGPNSRQEINAVAKWLMDQGTPVNNGNIDFGETIPNYSADTMTYDAAGARFLVVRDQFGTYIYTWPQQDSVGVGQQTPQLNENEETQTQWIERIKAQYPNVKFKEDKKTTTIVAYVNGMPVDEFNGQMDLFNEDGDEVIDRPPTRTPQREEVPVHMPGGSTVVIFNDGKTPAEVVVEAIVAATGLPASEAFARMMRAHKGGWAPIAAYASRDVAETKADQIMRHARSNTNYDHYRQHPALRGFTGPWPLHAEVMDADGN